MTDADKQTPKKRRVGDGTPGPGRPKGSENRTTVALRAAILGAFDQAGGEQYLLRVAQTDPKTFCTLLGKVLPQEIKAEHSGPDGGPIQTAGLVEKLADLPSETRERLRTALRGVLST